MNPWQKEVEEYFVEWMLLGEVKRMPSGKRQRQPMKGQWMSYGRGKGMRGSDLPRRHYLCIDALHRIGEHSIDNAAVLVAGKEVPHATTSTAIYRHANVLRGGYYDEAKRRRHLGPGSTDLLGIWFRFYLSWRNWVLYSPEATLQYELARYPEGYERTRLKTLIHGIRRQAGGQLIEAAGMCNCMGPLALSFLDHDIASLREHAGELIQRISKARARFQPQTGTHATEHTV
jgi:hypothetical protein